MVDVLLLVPARDEPRFADSWSPLFERLAAPLRAKGLTVESQPWTDPIETWPGASGHAVAGLGLSRPPARMVRFLDASGERRRSAWSIRRR
jgi:hypothetical protein